MQSILTVSYFAHPCLFWLFCEWVFFCLFAFFSSSAVLSQLAGKSKLLLRRLDYQPLFEKWARAPPPRGHKRAAEIEPNCYRLLHGFNFIQDFHWLSHHGTWAIILIYQIFSLARDWSKGIKLATITPIIPRQHSMVSNKNPLNAVSIVYFL